MASKVRGLDRLSYITHRIVQEEKEEEELRLKMLSMIIEIIDEFKFAYPPYLHKLFDNLEKIIYKHKDMILKGDKK